MSFFSAFALTYGLDPRFPYFVGGVIRIEKSAPELNAFVDRVGTQEFEAQVKDLTMPIEFSLENMNYFIDWTKSSPFEVIRGEGECAV